MNNIENIMKKHLKISNILMMKMQEGIEEKMLL